MSNLESVREQWIAERPLYVAFTEHVTMLLRAELQARGLLCAVDGRAKTVASLLKKVLRKSYGYEQITDKAGARVVVTFGNDVEVVERAIRSRFEVLRYENKTLGLDAHELGYLGIHFDVSVRDGGDSRLEWRNLTAEIQVQTKAQNCWADVSHRLLYKSAQEPPPEIRRRVYRLMALIELFDETVQGARKATEMLAGAPEARLLATLESHFYQFVGRAYDRDLSLDIIGVLEHLYGNDEQERFDELITQFVNSNQDKLKDLFAAYYGDERANPLIFQPETLLVFERLERDAFRLREAWSASFPLQLLENLATIWGRTV
jgi:ppGpp synthetase/RelA/SpoT-type nucleotidyltranferase